MLVKKVEQYQSRVHATATQDAAVSSGLWEKRNKGSQSRMQTERTYNRVRGRWKRWLCSSKDPRAARHFPFSSNVGSVSYKDLGTRMAMQDYSGILFGFS